MTQSKRRLITKLVRFQNRVDLAQERYDEAASYDAEFDGGEFSGPESWRAFEREQDRIAQELGFACADLAYNVAERLRATVSQPATMHGFEMPLPR